jgi:putative (di)nucleoside polyphosphate hydrolase
MPEGGIDAGETPRQAASRELREEVGTGRADILAESRGWFHHDVPEEIAQGIMGGRYRGNRQKWFAMRFTGSDADVNLATEHPEFDAWKWVKPQQLPELVVPFMHRLYLDILAEFRGLVARPLVHAVRVAEGRRAPRSIRTYPEYSEFAHCDFAIAVPANKKSHQLISDDALACGSEGKGISVLEASPGDKVGAAPMRQPL